MTHYRALLDPGEFLGPQDFPTEREVTISRATCQDMEDREKKGKTKRTPVIYIMDKNGVEYPRKFKTPKTVLFGLSVMLGEEVEAWAGKKIVIFKTRCKSFGDVEECLRVKFPADIEARVYSWMKKRKVSRSAYMLPANSTATQDEAPE